MIGFCHCPSCSTFASKVGMPLLRFHAQRYSFMKCLTKLWVIEVMDLFVSYLSIGTQNLPYQQFQSHARESAGFHRSWRGFFDDTKSPVIRLGKDSGLYWGLLGSVGSNGF